MSDTERKGLDPIRAGRFLMAVLNWKMEQERLGAEKAVAAETETTDGVAEVADSRTVARRRTRSRRQRADRSAKPAQE